MRIILLEVRDRMTFIPVMAVDTLVNFLDHEFKEQRYLLLSAGYSRDGKTIILVNLNSCRAANDPYEWGNSRTMTTAHDYIEKHWAELKDGDVIDVEFILGETTEKKTSERFEK